MAGHRAGPSSCGQRARRMTGLRQASKSIVAPANAGAHTPRPLLPGKSPAAFFNRNSGGYGSLRSQGRLAERSRTNADTGAAHDRIAITPKSLVAPANAGAHTPRPLLPGKPSAAF